MALPRRAKASRCGSVWKRFEHAALRHHGVEVEILLQPFPQFHRPFVERIVPGQHVVGADDRGVAPDIAGAQPAFFQHRHIGDAMHLRQIIGGRKPMPAAADDDDVIVLFGLRIAPGRRPVLVAGERVLEKREDGIFHFRPIDSFNSLPPDPARPRPPSPVRPSSGWSHSGCRPWMTIRDV